LAPFYLTIIRYQGAQHTQNNPMFGNPDGTQIPIDAEKKQKLEDLGYPKRPLIFILFFGII
jgi:hypothetical protein